MRSKLLSNIDIKAQLLRLWAFFIAMICVTENPKNLQKFLHNFLPRPMRSPYSISYNLKLVENFNVFSWELQQVSCPIRVCKNLLAA